MKNFILFLSVAVFAVACNKGADPKKDYSDVKTVPKHSNGNPNQDALMSPFSFKMISTSDIGVATFVAGVKDKKITFEVSPAPSVTKYRVEVMLKPDGSSFEKVPGQENMFVLSWNPDRNEPANKVGFQFRAVVEDASVLRLRNTAGESEVFIINVDRQNNQPKILGINGITAKDGNMPEVAVGTTVKLTIVGEDPLSSPQTPPELIPLGCQTGNNQERPKETGTKFLVPVSVTSVGGNRFHYRYDLDLDTNDIKDSPDKEGFEVCFGFMLLNETRRSNSVSQNVKVMYLPNKPEINMPTGTRPVLLGKSFDFGIEVTVPGSEIGTLEVTTTELNATNFPGEAKLEEKKPTARNARRKNSASKIFSWKVASNPEALGKKYTLRVDAVHTVKRGDKEVKQSHHEIVEFVVTDQNVVGTPRATGTPRTPAPTAGGK